MDIHFADFRENVSGIIHEPVLSLVKREIMGEKFLYPKWGIKK